jgi:hypothetical protein
MPTAPINVRDTYDPNRTSAHRNWATSSTRFPQSPLRRRLHARVKVW